MDIQKEFDKAEDRQRAARVSEAVKSILNKNIRATMALARILIIATKEKRKDIIDICKEGMGK
jgi:hypothetical protein